MPRDKFHEKLLSMNECIFFDPSCIPSLSLLAYDPRPPHLGPLKFWTARRSKIQLLNIEVYEADLALISIKLGSDP